MLKKIYENVIWWVGVITIGIVLGITMQFVRAWVEPTGPAPGGNVGAPINTSSIAQVKDGGLGVLALRTFGLRLPTGAGAGKVLTSDAAGNASWQEASGSGTTMAKGTLAGNCADSGFGTNGNYNSCTAVSWPAIKDKKGACSCDTGFILVVTGWLWTNLGDSEPCAYYACMKQ